MAFVGFVLLCLCNSVFAQKSTDYPLNLRSFDEQKVKKLKSNPEYDYTEDIETYREYDRDWQWKQWRWEEEQRHKAKEGTFKKTRPKETSETNFSLGKNFIYVAITILIIFLILMLLGFDFKSWFVSNRRSVSEKEITEENLDKATEVQIEELLQKAIKEQNYNLALRYAYLKALQLLSKKGLIELSKQKTNSDYQTELRQKQNLLYNDFKQISRIFAYVKYGEFVVSEEQFKVLYPTFESFYQKI